MATIEADTLFFSELVSSLPSQPSLSSLSSTSSLDTKFSYPENITITIRPPTSDTSIKESATRIRSTSLIVKMFGSRWKISWKNLIPSASSSRLKPR
ncbi:Uncharacterised protein [Vibrio cholerae]|nr:Uncharacterised protein [Vibrio cholerae]